MRHDPDNRAGGRAGASLPATGGVSLGRPTVLLLFGRAAVFPLALVNALVVARTLGVERLGAYAYAMGLAALFGLLPNLGISTLLSRTIARDPDASAGMVSAGIRAQALLAAAILIVVPTVAAALPEQPVPIWYVILAAAQLSLGTLSWPHLAILGGRARYDRLAVVEVAAAVTGSIAVVTAAVVHGEVPAFLCAHVVAAGISVSVARRVARPYRPTAGADPVTVRGLFRQAAPLGAGAAVQSLYTRLDTVMLGQLAPPAALGLYSAAYKPINVATSLGGTVAGVLLPVMAPGSQDGAPPAFWRATRALWAAGPALALALTGLASPLLRLLFGTAYEPAAPLLGLLAWSCAVNWLYAPLAIALQARDRERSWLLALALAAVANFAGNAWAIPRWEGLGAAGATLVSECLVLASATVLVRRQLGIAPPLRLMFGSAAGATAGALVLVLLHGGGAFVATGLAVATHVGVLALFGIVGRNDLGIVLAWVKDAVVPRSAE